MPFDAVFLKALTGELARGAMDCRVDRVHQPARDQVVLHLRGREGVRRLLLCAGPNHPRAHFTEAPLENPAQPPMFCRLLRKHLSGGKVAAVRQYPMERVLELTFACIDELGEPAEKRLILEIMGRNSNLILCGGDGRILDCLRRVDFEMSEKRQVLPGLYYQAPPAQDRRDPAQTDRAAILRLLEAVEGPRLLDKWLLDTFLALPPLICRELSYTFCGDTACDLALCDRTALADHLDRAFRALETGPYTPVMLLDQGEPKDFSYRPIGQYGMAWETEEFSDFSSLLDRFYAQRDRAAQMRQRAQAMQKAVSNLRGRTERKLAHQRQELEATFDRERLRRLGDIVTANLHTIQRGQARLKAVDFYDPEMAEIEIPLSPQLSPQQNAAKFYKEYAKAKNAEKVLRPLIAQGEQELAYLHSILDELSRAESEKDLQEIRAELVEGGYLRRTGGKKQMKQPPSRPMEFRSSEGYPIFVGRSNRQNDQLTCKAAAKNDLWLHTQKIHGSHVIIACGGARPGDETITQAAMLAAWYSQGRAGQNIPVDMTQVRNVKKPAGAKPGMVVYDRYTTVTVTPDPALPERLRVK